MFFKRKKKESAADDGPTSGSDASRRRRFYRRSPGRKHALGVRIERQGRVLGSGEVGDLSIGGVRLSFPRGGYPPELRAGEEVDLAFDSLAHPGKVLARARYMRSTPQKDGSVQQAFAFTDLEALYPQLDAFFWNFFNRRRVVRVRPALDRRLPLVLLSGTTTVEVAINDLSSRGLGFVLDPARAEPLLASGSYEISFPVPGSEERFSARSERRHATPHGKNVLLGLEFEEAAAAKTSPALARYLADREAEMARWE